MVNLASEARERKRLSTSPADHASPRPSRDGGVMLSHQKSPMLKAVEKVVLEEASGGEDHRDGRKWYEGGGGGSGDSIQIDLADTALRAVRDGSVIATVESGYSNPEGGKKRSSKTVSITMSLKIKLRCTDLSKLSRCISSMAMQ